MSLAPDALVNAGMDDHEVSRSGIVSILEIFDDFLFPPESFPQEEIVDRTNADDNEDSQRRKRGRVAREYSADAQKVDRREKNREHAKRSRVRKKFLVESLQQSVHALEEENEKLRHAIQMHLPKEATSLLSQCASGTIVSEYRGVDRSLGDTDFSLLKALKTTQQNFVISDPSVPDNPIVYASQGFLTLSGYTLEEVLGRNCRFLQGPDTSQNALAKIRAGIERGEDATVILLNYRKDGSTFWNQLFIAALRDGQGNIVNYLGVQCKVGDDYATAYIETDRE